jgi:Flp pilus assembly pilin Flp
MQRLSFPFHLRRTPVPGMRNDRRRELGQATVEYVGLAVAVAVLLVAIGGGLAGHGGKLGEAVAKRLTDAIAAKA